MTNLITPDAAIPAMESRTPLSPRPAGPASGVVLSATPPAALLPPVTDEAEPSYFRAAVIADATGLSKKTIHRRAAAEQWPARGDKNRLEYLPPANILAKLSGAAPAAVSASPSVRFHDLHDPDQRERTLLKQKIVLHYRECVASGATCGLALASAMLFAQRQCEAIAAALAGRPFNFNFSQRSIQRWDDAYRLHGLDGLVEQKLGIVGKKSCVSKLSPEQKLEVELRGKALAIGHNAGRATINVARAAQILATDPTLPAPLRGHVHGGHAKKSHVTPSVRALITPSLLTAGLAQGPRHARLSGCWTPGDYSSVKAGDVFVADDMTSNVLCWCEWPNADGWKIAQAQILPVLDVGSLRWLNFRVVLRSSGAYVIDDIAGLLGDLFDGFGLPRRGLLFEGGLWQSDKLKGHRTDLTADERIGGLEALGLKVWHTRTPMGKGMIEGAFHKLQSAMDNIAGFIGREQRYDLQEDTEFKRKLCERGGAHPKEFFLHVSQLADHLREAMERLNQERNDGKILRGFDHALDKWMAESADLKTIPDACKWMYRSALWTGKVTRNGILIQQGSGRNLRSYYYDNPALRVPLQGKTVCAYWNDANPDADAVVLAIQPRRKVLGTFQRVKEISRFDASPEELDSEAARKKAERHYSRTELRAIQPHMARAAKPIPYDAAAANIGKEITAAHERAQEKDRARAKVRRSIASHRADLTPADLAAATDSDPVGQGEPLTADDLAAATGNGGRHANASAAELADEMSALFHSNPDETSM